jgi:AcrR family transcriptional regulator
MDRRVLRTRTALVEAFNRLALSRRRGRIRVGDIIAQANVGRSTFYDHFAGAEAIRMEALVRPFAVLADAAAGLGNRERLTGLLRHFWEHRQLARETLGARSGQAGRLLAEMVAERLPAAELRLPAPLAALQLAEAALAPIRGWVTAAAPCSCERLAEAICLGGEELLRALSAPPATEPAS